MGRMPGGPPASKPRPGARGATWLTRRSALPVMLSGLALVIVTLFTFVLPHADTTVPGAELRAASSDSGALRQESRGHAPPLREGGEWDEEVFASLQEQDRVAEAVHVMPGGRTVEGTLLMEAELMQKYFYCANSWTMCKVPVRFRRCKWCPHGSHDASKCLKGLLEANGGTMFYRHTEQQRERMEVAARAFTWQEPLASNDPLVDAMLFSCKLRKPVPMGVTGSLLLRLPRREARDAVTEFAVARHLRRTPPVAPPGSVATCGRATYGDVNANHIIQMSEYLRFHGFQSLYVYNAGSTTMHNALKLEAYLTRLRNENSTALRYIDLRNHLDALFGGAAQFAFLSSHSGGQEWTKYDCALRARRDGHDWILHTDLDEYIFPGKAMIEDDLMKPMAERLKAQVEEGMKGLSLGSVKAPCDEDVNPESSWPLEPTESRARWESFMRRVSKRYLDVVLKDPLKYFPTNGNHPRKPEGNPCEDYHMCLNGAGTRKLFLKSSYPPIELRVHVTYGNGTVDLDADVLHAEHYRCMNAAGEAHARLMAFPAPIPADAARPPIPVSRD